ncbi:MAG: alpha/beta hydrolase [Deltaproteobacteria bacterium]|nr:alpha/beta hydrolase [Deltaproteobacteria bacterium]
MERPPAVNAPAVNAPAVNAPALRSARLLTRAQRAVVGGLLRTTLEGLARAGRALPWARRRLRGLSVTRDVSYGPLGRHHLLDVYARAGDQAGAGAGAGDLRPALLYLHGGGFRILSKDTHWPFALPLAEAGYVVFCVNYRLAPAHPCPAALEDACLALEWLWEHAARFGADPRNISVAGESAGGNLTLALALALSRPGPAPWARRLFERAAREGRALRAALPACGFLDVRGAPTRLRGRVHPAVLSRIRALSEAYTARSPLPALADPLVELEDLGAPLARPLPPMLVAVGGADPVLLDSERLRDALAARGVESEFHLYPGETHAFHALLWRPAARACWGAQLAFLDRFARVAPLALLLAALLAALLACAAPAAAAPVGVTLRGNLARYTLTAVGDQSALLLDVENPGAQPRTLSFGPRGGEQIEREIGGYERARLLVQCVRVSPDAPAPALSFAVNDEPLEGVTTAATRGDLRPALWIENPRARRAPGLLGRAVSAAAGVPLRSLRADEVPTHLAALAGARLLVVNLDVLSLLTPPQRALLRAVVATGATLVVGVGSLSGDARLLKALSPVDLGDLESDVNVSTLLRTPSRRRLFTGAGSYPLITLEGKLLLAESRLGLGRVRVLGVPVESLAPGRIAQVALAADDAAAQQLSRWLTSAAPPLAPAEHIFSDPLALYLAALPLLFWLTRRRPSLAAAAVGGWALVVTLRPPLPAPALVTHADLLYVPLAEGALTLSSLDVSSSARGARLVELAPAQVSLAAALTEGSCLIQSLPSERDTEETFRPRAWLSLDAGVGERQRLHLLAAAQGAPSDDPLGEAARVPAWPPGPWSGAALTPLAPLPSDVPLLATPGSLRAWRLPLSLDAPPPPPLALSAQPQE